MTKLGKVLVVFVTAAAMAIMAFAGVAVVGGPNWVVEQRAEDLNEYRFEVARGEKTTHSVTHIRGEQPLKSNVASRAETVIAARQDLQKRQQEELQQLEQQIPAAQARLEQIQQLMEIDLAALERRELELKSQLEAVQNEVDLLSDRTVKRSQEATNKEIEANERRDDVFRLRNQLDLLRTNLFKAVEQRTQQEDLLIRLRAAVKQARERNQQLKDSGAEPPDYDPKDEAQ